MSMNIPMTKPTPAIVLSAARPAYVYANGQKTDQRVLDSKGAPVSRAELVGPTIGSDILTYRVEVQDSIAESLAPGQMVVLMNGEGSAFAMSGGDFGSVRVKAIGIAKIEQAGSAAPLFDHVLNGGK